MTRRLVVRHRYLRLVLQAIALPLILVGGMLCWYGLGDWL